MPNCPREMKYSSAARNRIRMRSGTSISEKNRQGVLSMFENRRLNRLLETGEYQLPASMRHWIADAAHWIAPTVTFFVSIMVAALCIIWGTDHPDEIGYRGLVRALAVSVGITQFLFVGLGSFWMFMERSFGPESWYDLAESCTFLGLTLDELAREPLDSQTFRCKKLLKELAGKVVLAEKEHPGNEYHPYRLFAKHQFEKAFMHFQRVGWIQHDEGYGKFFGQ